jgi:hypothetical protein
MLLHISTAEIEDFAMPEYSTVLTRAIIDYVKNFFFEMTSTVNVFYVSNSSNFIEIQGDLNSKFKFKFNINVKVYEYRSG